MTETPSAWVVREWSECFSTALREIAGIEVRLEITTAHEIPANLTCWQQEFNTDAGQALAVSVGEEDILTISAAIRAALGLTGTAASPDRGLYIALIRRSMTALAVVLSRGCSQVVTSVGGREIADSAMPGNTYRIVISFAGQDLALYITIPPAWEEWPLGQKCERGEESIGSRTMPLLLDVEVPVRISFGRTSLPINEALKLVTGSLLELNRGAGDSVELIVSNRVIAHGEVVVVDGNYGIRITQVISRKERLTHGRQQLIV